MDVSLLVVASLLTLVWVIQVDGDVYVKDLKTNHTIKQYSDMQASFGPDFPTDGLEGWLVYASPEHDACIPVQAPPVNETWCKTKCNYILLIARGGNCEFSDKVLNAQEHGYAAVIVHNYINNENAISMGGGDNGSRVTIPSTFVGYTNGMELWHNYSYTHQQYVIKIIDDDEDLRLFLWPFAVVVGVCFLIFMVFMLVKLLRDHASKKMNRLSRKHLKKIPVRKFKKGDYYDTCAICLDEYEEGEKIRVLPCDHVYHTKCIDPWLTKSKKTCPVCKRRVIPGRDADSESDSDTGDRQANTGDSESTPLLSGSSDQSHGSVAQSGILLNTSDSVTQSQGNVSSMDGSNIPPDAEHGAVGGEGISDRNQRHQTLLTGVPPGRGNIQEPNGSKDSHSERKRKRKNWTRIVEDEEAAGTSLASETGAEHRERRKLRKDKKKKAENRHRRQDGAETMQENLQHKNESEGNIILEADVNNVSADVMQTDDAQMKTDGEGGYANPVYSDSHEVVVPTSSGRREMNDMV